MDIEYTKDNPLRCFFAFEGYNSQGLALNRLKHHYPDFDWVCVGRSEIDKYAIQAADALFPEAKDKNFGDISKIDWNEVPDFDLFTYSFPCTNLSFAGKQEGCEEGSGTASSLLWECRKAIIAKRPKYLLMENVKALVSQKFLPYFIKWQNELASYGYSNFAKVLNASSYGIPQNRERIFMVSILDENASYHFPKPFPLDKRLKDVLEEDVDEKYYLSKKLVDYVFSNGGKEGNIQCAIGVHDKDDDVVNTVTAQYWETPRQGNYIKEPIEPRTDGLGATGVKVISNIYGNNVQGGRIYDDKGISPTIGANTGGNLQPKILSYTRDANGKVVDRHFKDVANTIHGSTGGGGNTDSFVFEPKIIEVAKKVEEMVNKSRSVKCGVSISKDNRIVAFQYDKKRSSVSEYKIDNENGVSQTVISAHEPKVYGESTEYRIRKLTEREVFRLMDVYDADIDKIQAAGISRSQQYKMAGNSICTGVLFHIFRKLFVDKENENKQLTLF